MDEECFDTMMELCMQLGAARFHDKALNEEEALLYEQLCRTITKQVKINELAIDASMDDIKNSFPEPKHPDDEPPDGAPA